MLSLCHGAQLQGEKDRRIRHFDGATIYLAAALRDNGGSRLTGSKMEEGKIARTREHLDTAGLDDLVEIRPGDALETLKGVGGEVDLRLLGGAFRLICPCSI